MNWIKKQFSKETWSPYAAGVLLGLVVILAVLLSHSLVGASGAFENLAGIVGKAIVPAAWIHNNAYGFTYRDEVPRLTGFHSFSGGELSFYPIRYDYPQPLLPALPPDTVEFPARTAYCREVQAYTNTDRCALRLRPADNTVS